MDKITEPVYQELCKYEAIAKLKKDLVVRDIKQIVTYFMNTQGVAPKEFIVRVMCNKYGLRY